MRIDALLSQLEPGSPAVLVTVARVEGSAPREAGASMAVTRTTVVGSIGGGRLEHAAIARARTLLGRPDASPILERHALGPGLGQCCGGAVTLWIAPLGVFRRRPAWHAALAAAGRARRPVVLATVIASEHAAVAVGARLVFDATRVEHADVPRTLAAPLVAAAREVLAANGGRADCVRLASPGASVVLLVEPDPDDAVTVVFGAGHVGRALVAILSTLPGRVTWIDARPDAFPAAPPPGVDCRVAPCPEDEVDEAPAGASYVVLTHDHALDLALATAILRRDDVAYFGLIGSATKRERFVRRLRTRGVPAERIAEMRCPIGLAGVGGKAPGEVAVAIAAELLAHRARARRTGARPRRDAFSAS